MHTEAFTEEGLKLFSALASFDDFYLAAGRRWHFRSDTNSPSISICSATSRINRTLLPKIQKVFEEFSVSPAINNPDELTAFINNVKITFLSYPFPIIEPCVLADRLQMLSVIEIGAP